MASFVLQSNALKREAEQIPWHGSQGLVGWRTSPLAPTDLLGIILREAAQ
jgi:hypothetical protein